MRRPILVLLIVMMGAIGLVSTEGATGQEEAPPEPEPIFVAPGQEAPPVFGPLTGVWQESVEVTLEPAPDPQLTEAHASDSCAEAAPLAMQTFGTAGDRSVVNDMTWDTSDPILGCMWGTPENPRGYRTVWYRFEAPVSGHLVVNTSFEASNFIDSYDTVLALYHSDDITCDSLTMMACDDDSYGFFSEVTAFVIEGENYYIEVADRSPGVQGPATLRLAVVLEEGETLWERFGEDDDAYSEPSRRTRHSLVSDGRFIYLISGETFIDGHPAGVGRVDRFDAETRTWERLRPIPREYYSRTSAALLGGKIYVPSGYIGNNQAYDGQHFVYDIATNEWDEGVNVPWADASESGEPYAWHQAVAAPMNNGYFVTGGLLEGDPEQLIPPISIVPTDSLLFYNANTSNWRTDLPGMETARFAHVADLLNTPQGRQVCVAGGLTRIESEDQDDQAGVVSTVECYNIATQQWETRAQMNFPRFSAGSAVSPDGKWYVFGGVNSSLTNVTLTEVYDPMRDTWEVLDSRYSVRRPGRGWVRGAFAADALWIFGGEQLPGNEVIPLAERLPLPEGDLFIPATFFSSGQQLEPNDTMAEAVPIALGQEVRETFQSHADFFDFFRFNVTIPDVYVGHLSNIPAERNYDVYIYNDDKLLVGDSTNVGNQEEFAETFPLDPGTYYVMVLRAFGEPGGEPYRLVVTRGEP